MRVRSFRTRVGVGSLAVTAVLAICAAGRAAPTAGQVPFVVSLALEGVPTPGEPFTVTVDLAVTTGVRAWVVDVLYDPRVLEAVPDGCSPAEECAIDPPGVSPRVRIVGEAIVSPGTPHRVGMVRFRVHPTVQPGEVVVLTPEGEVTTLPLVPAP